MRKRARTDLCGGRSAMVVPTASINNAHGGSGLELCATDMVRLKPTGKEVRRISPDMSTSRQFHEPAEPKPERLPRIPVAKSPSHHQSSEVSSRRPAGLVPRDAFVGSWIDKRIQFFSRRQLSDR